MDINCDMGEGIGNEAALMPLVSSANIACGFHAGDEATMRATVALAMRCGVRIGAHPSFRDRENFGRTEQRLDTGELYLLVRGQLQLIGGIIAQEGARLFHVKPHGALYNMAARSREMAATICRAVKDFDPALVLYGHSGSCLVSEAEALGLQVWSEVFADRTYRADGALTPRTEPGALIQTEEDLLAQLERLLDGQVKATDGTLLRLKADTICLHGDGPHALGFAKALRKRLNGV